METTFIKINSTILSSTKLTLSEKVLISIILSFQNNNQTCTKSNQTLAQELSMSEKSLKRMITKLNKTNWFKSSKTSKFNENGKWNNSKEMKINVDELLIFLENKEYNQQPEKKIEEKLIELPSVEIKKEVLAPQVILTQEQKEENELLNSLALTNTKTECDFDFGDEITEATEETNTITFTNSFGDVFTIPSTYNEVIEWCSERKKIFDELKKKKTQFHLIWELDNQIERMKDLTCNV